MTPGHSIEAWQTATAESLEASRTRRRAARRRAAFALGLRVLAVAILIVAVVWLLAYSAPAAEHAALAGALGEFRLMRVNGSIVDTVNPPNESYR